MRLKSISLHGFKSFQARTEIPLGGGITAIVGPNGCGKTNVSDAIRWVLGEGNVRNLRGENILDVIFKGTGATKPAGFAEVSLLVDNEDHSLPLDQAEVAIARRVHRTGESDFLINNLACRLKDIRNLFLGTGLGSQGYSVIERGMVDAVLSDRDDQRRLFFEEAAGISRYKLQRKEAVRKLDATEQDLMRIDDIVREIERDVRSLARQVGKARKHRRLHDQIRDLEVDLAIRRWTELENHRRSCASEHDLESGDRERLSTELVRLEAEHETRKIGLMERERLLEEARRSREAILSERASAREEIGVLSTQIQGGESRAIELTRRITEETERSGLLRERVASLGPETEELAREQTRRSEEVKVAEERFSGSERLLQEARSALARTAQVQMEHLVVRTKEHQEFESLSLQVEQLDSRCAELESRRERVEKKTEDLEGEVATVEREIVELASRLERIGREREDNEAARAVAHSERERMHEALIERVRHKTSLESRLNLLEEQKVRHEGFDAGVKSLLERAGMIPGIHGVVGELIAPAPDLSTPRIEALIGETIQWVVVQNEETAVAVLDHLRQAGLGGVTLFPLDENAGRFSGAKKYWGSAPPLRGPSDLDPLIEFLLSRTRPVENRQEARASARWEKPSLRYLSPEGEVYASEGWIRTPGGQGGDSELIGRMQEIPRLEASCRQCEVEEEEIKRIVRSYEEETEKLVETGRIQTEEQDELTDRHRRLETQLSERRVERGLLQEEIQRIRTQLEGDKVISDKVRGEREALKVRLGETDVTEQEADRRHQEAQGAEQTAAGARDEALEQLSARRTELIRIENALQDVKNTIQRDTEEMGRLESAIRQWEGERDEAVELQERGRTRRTDLEERDSELDEQLRQVDAELDRKRSERDEEQTLLAAHEQEIKQARSELTGLQEKLHDGRVRELEIRSEMDRIRERILQEFRVDLEKVARERKEPPVTVPEEAAEDFDEDQRRLEIDGLRQKLLKLGPVNFLAAEAYDQQKERLLFHRKERDDLRTARSDLLDAIQQINETAGRMFEETFVLARRHFQETFQQLFPGGEADVTLNGEDPLEGSIEISARPHGKKLEAIRLLSTGERSLTAIALLFGIYLVKPSPFCILDELDAPLDDANIGRFVAMLRHFSERTQFVVITHNKRTMEAADRLYGVTMQQAGISRIVSVRLSDADLDLSPEAAQVLSASEGDTEHD